jgi:hypothetical protein
VEPGCVKKIVTVTPAMSCSVTGVDTEAVTDVNVVDATRDGKFP